MGTKSLRFLLLITNALIFSLALQGQQTKVSEPGKPQEEAFVIEQSLTRVHFENDGTGTRQVSSRIRIQSEAGVQAFGQLVFGYSSATEKLDVDYVRVRKPDGQVVETPSASAQDFAPEVIKAVPMYSDYRERHLTVMGLRPGDVLEYRITTRTVKAIVPGEFWDEYSFPRNVTVNEDRLQIEVPAGRNVTIKSPGHKYETSDAAGYRTYNWVVKDIVPDRKDRNDDEQDADDDDSSPDVQVTTFRDWSQVAQWYGKLQGEQVVVNDAIRQKAAELTRGVTSQSEKMHRIYDYVSKNFRYVSLSFGVGRYQPHSAPEVLQNGFGDCKDKHTLLSALLKAEGIESYPALMNSSRKIDPDVPSPAQFDHVITAVRAGGGFIWLDSTPGIAPFGLIAYPLRNKQALISSQDQNAGLHTTPSASPVKTSLAFNIDGKLTATGAYDAMVDVTATGDSDLRLRLVFRTVAQADWKKLVEIVSYSWGLPGDISEVTLDPLEDTSKPFHLRYHYHRDNYLSVPSTDARLLAFPSLSFPRLRKSGSKPIDLGPVAVITQHTHLQFADNYKVTVPMQINLVRDYGEYVSTYKLQGRTLDAERRLTIKMSELPAIRRTDAESLRSVATNDVSQVISCTITAATGKEEPSPATNMSADELHNAGTKALNQGDFSGAVRFLKKFVEKDPKDPDAWDELGRAYVGLNNGPEALAAFQKQVEVNPFHARGYSDLGSELQRSGKLEEAVAAFRKQLENNPSSKTAHKQLGLLLAGMKRYQDARSELETAASLPPADVEVVLALAEVYMQTGDAGKGQTLLQSLVGSATPFAAGDVYSAALREDIKPEQTITDAQKVLDDIGEQFDSGAYSIDDTALSSMQFIGLEWARIGWAHFLNSDLLKAMRYLDAAWNLTQSGTVANRLGRVYEAAGQRAKAQHMFAMAVAAGGAEEGDSRERLAKLMTANTAVDRTISDARSELSRNATVKLSSAAPNKVQAEFLLEFDGSSKPQRAVFQKGDTELQDKTAAALKADYPVIFPDYSSIKVIRRTTLTCTTAGCEMTVQPIGELRNALQNDATTSPAK